MKINKTKKIKEQNENDKRIKEQKDNNKKQKDKNTTRKIQNVQSGKEQQQLTKEQKAT